MTDPIVTHYDGSGNVLSTPHGNGLFQLNYVSGPTANVYYFKHHAPSQTLTYNTSTGKWTDTNTAAPTGIASSHNGTFVAFTSGVVLDTEKIFISETINGNEVCIGGILNPFWSGAGGGGSGTSGGVGFTASFYDVTSTHFSWEVTHTSGFTAPQTYELHSTTMTPTFISDVVVGGAIGSSTSRTHTWGTPDVIQIMDAYGTIGAELTLSHAPPTTRKKVFCNFW